jgi:hypothetical protein
MLQAILRFCSLEETLVVDAMAALARRRASRMDAEERTKVRRFIFQYYSISFYVIAPFSLTFVSLLSLIYLLPLFFLITFSSFSCSFPSSPSSSSISFSSLSHPPPLPLSPLTARGLGRVE